VVEPSIFLQKTCHISKTTYFSTFHFCVVIFSDFLFFHTIFGVLQKTLVSTYRWALGLVTAAQPCDRQGQRGPIPCMFFLFLAFLTFSICSIVFRPA
jgi:hypothetical protein